MEEPWRLVTDRLVVRVPTPADAADMAERRSDPTTEPWQAWLLPYPLDRAEAMCRRSADLGRPTAGSAFQPIVTLRADGPPVGDLAVMLAEHGHTAEIGWTLHPWARGHGYATEAATALCDHLVHDIGVHRLEAHIHPGNAASRAVLDRLGLVSEGVLREAFWRGEEVTDDEVFGLLAREWTARDR